MTPDRPNIIFIHTDSMDGRLIGCMGHPAMRNATPHLDRLAERGVLFRNCYSNNPICCPSRASMWSGLFTHHCEGWNNFKGLERGARTFEDPLKEAGYAIAKFGKEDYLSGAHTIRARVSPWTRSAMIERPNYRTPAPEVFERDSERCHKGDWNNLDRAMDWLKREGAPGRKPFLLFLGINKPHPSFNITRNYLDRIDAAAVDLPAADEADHPVARVQRIQKNWTHGFDERAVRAVRRIYFAMIAEVDAMAGRLIAAVDELGLRQNTYIIFGSDHGELAMEHRQYYKMSPYEPSARVPMIVAGPGLLSGAQTPALVSLVDIYPTLLEMAGLDAPQGLDGYSLMSEARGLPGVRPDWVLSECHDSTTCTGIFMLRRGDAKYVVHNGFEPQLFDLRADPGEVRDLARQRPEAVHDMDRLLRSVVDYEAVDAKVKAYDKASFVAWRDEGRRAGTYERNMAMIFSGWDELAPADVKPWTADDEAIIRTWLGET